MSRIVLLFGLLWGCGGCGGVDRDRQTRRVPVGDRDSRITTADPHRATLAPKAIATH